VGSHDVVTHLVTGPQADVAMPTPMTALPNSDQLMSLITQLVENLKRDEMEPLLEESESDTEEQPLQRSFNVRRPRVKQASSFSLTKSQSLRSLNKYKPDGTKDTSFSAQHMLSFDASQGQPPSSTELVIPIVSVTEIPSVDSEGGPSSTSLKGSSSRFLLPPATTNQKRKDAAKKMIEKHTIENIRLETSLHEQEVAAIRSLLEEAEQKNKDMLAEAAEEMKKELSAAHKEEKEQLVLSKLFMASHAIIHFNMFIHTRLY